MGEERGKASTRAEEMDGGSGKAARGAERGMARQAQSGRCRFAREELPQDLHPEAQRRSRFGA